MAFRAALAVAALTLAIPVAGQDQVDWNAAAVTEVTLDSFSFTPKVVNLLAGTPTKLVLRNEKGGHSFSAPAFFASSRIAPEDREKIKNGKIEIDGGETVTIRLVPTAGTYKLTCTHFMHNTLGMSGKIVVQ